MAFCITPDARSIRVFSVESLLVVVEVQEKSMKAMLEICIAVLLADAVKWGIVVLIRRFKRDCENPDPDV